VLNTRGIWYLYEVVDGSQRGVLLIGNPLTMLLGLPALAWCALAGSARRDAARLAAVIGYGVSLGLWVIAPKPVQFYYHYLMPGTFLLAALALTLADLRRSGQAGALLAWSVLGGSLAVFAWFLPILSAAPLAEGPMSFMRWMWLDSWR
jgi:dolichyl-phosphate-mannose--protein O-mannosyl transferase